MPRIMAIDYGGKRTGIAWTDPLQIIATGVGSYDTSRLEQIIKALCSKEDIEAFVVGYPTRTDGSDTHATPLVRAFAEELEKWYPDTPIYLWDERLSSKLAGQAMLEGGANKKKRQNKHLINEVSATLILQEFMEEME